MTLERFQNFGLALPNPRLSPHLAEFEQALLDRSPDFLFERCAVIGDFAVARRILLENSTVFEKVTLTVENLDDEKKELDFVLSVERSFVDGSSRLSFRGIVRVDLTADEPFEQALGAASDLATDRMNRAIVALLELQSRTLSGL